MPSRPRTLLHKILSLITAHAFYIATAELGNPGDDAPPRDVKPSGSFLGVRSDTILLRMVCSSEVVLCHVILRNVVAVPVVLR